MLIFLRKKEPKHFSRVKKGYKNVKNFAPIKTLKFDVHFTPDRHRNQTMTLTVMCVDNWWLPKRISG